MDLLQEMYDFEELVSGDYHTKKMQGDFMLGTITFFSVCLGDNPIIGCWQDTTIAIGYIMEWFSYTNIDIKKVTKDSSIHYPHLYLHTKQFDRKITFRLQAFPLNTLEDTLVII